MTERISTYSLHQRLLTDTTRSQMGLANLQNQLSSGLKSETFQGLGNSVEAFVSLDSRVNRNQVFIDSSSVVAGRLNVADDALNSLIDSVGSLQNLLGQQRQTTSQDNLAFDVQIEAKWKEISTIINTSYEGRYLFSGTATGTKPVDDENFPTLNVDGVPDKGYYKGASENVSIRVDENFDVEFNARADDPALQKLFAGLAMAKKFGQTAGDSPQMKQAYDFVDDSLKGIISLRGTVNANKVAVEQNSERLSSLKLYWKGLQESISNTDILAVSTEVAVNQGILQAGFQAFAKISSLKLIDFLR